MIEEGAEAPAFELPAHVDGEQRRVALEDHVGQDVVVLAFYPADFNPACDRESGLDELDLFTMQKDLTVLAVSPDSVYSHAAFAEEYNLGVPLLADTRRRVAEAYDLCHEDDLGQSLVERAVLVLDHEGVVEYGWHTADPTELPDVEAIKEGIAGVGGDDTAQGRYRVGHAHYTEARRAFTSAMGAYEDSEWMLAQSDFHRAREEFDEATDHFDSAVRFADDPDHEAYYERAKEKASALWQSADWLGKSASAYSSGNGAEGRALKEDAQRPLENARDVGDPVHPDDWPPEEQLASVDGDPNERSEFGAAVDESVGEASVSGDPTGDAAPGDDASPTLESGGDPDPSPDEDVVDIDDDELEEIEAELAAEGGDATDDEVEAAPTSMVDAPPGTDEDGDVAADGADGDRRNGASAEPVGEGDGPQDGDIEGEVDEDDLAALEAELAGEDDETSDE